MTKQLALADLHKFMLGFDRFVNDTSVFSPMIEGGYPRFNILRVGERGYRIELAIPGWNKKDIEITLHKGLLTVAGKIKREEKEDEMKKEEEKYEATEEVTEEVAEVEENFEAEEEVNEQEVEEQFAAQQTDGVVVEVEDKTINFERITPEKVSLINKHFPSLY